MVCRTRHFSSITVRFFPTHEYTGKAHPEEGYKVVNGLEGTMCEERLRSLDVQRGSAEVWARGNGMELGQGRGSWGIRKRSQKV